MSGKDVAIPIVFPDYLISVDTPPLKIDVPDWLPGVPNVVTVSRTKQKLPYLGHAGILFFSGRTGLTKYFEYGRYDAANFGIVRRVPVPDVRLSAGRPTAKSLATTLAAVSMHSGQSGKIAGAYVELEPGACDKMLAYAMLRHRLNKDPKRQRYDLTTNSCMHFMRSVAMAGGATMPEVFDPRPTGYMEKARALFADLDFNRPASLTLEGVTLP
jgi:hypothetical protein